MLYNDFEGENSEAAERHKKKESSKETKETDQELIKDFNIRVRKSSNSQKQQKVEIFQNTKVVHHHHHYVTHIHHHHHHGESDA